MKLKNIVRSLLLVCGIAALFIGIAWMATLLSDVSFKDAAASVQAVITSIAIAAGGVFAFQRLQLFRTFEPHLTISHEVSHRQVSDNYVHIAITATLLNSSNVRIELRKRIIRIQQVAPISDEEVVSLYSQFFVEHESDSLQWPVLDEAPPTWDAIIVEPGENHRAPFEFIVTAEVETVAIYTYFFNSQFSLRTQAAEGWGTTTVYNTVTGAHQGYL